jgi:aminomethyltransferase
VSDLRRTPFYSVQAARGARFVPFAGYEMPVQFSGLIAEHQAVRTAAGVFDVSHMGEVIVEGAEALEAMQWLVTNDNCAVTDVSDEYAQLAVQGPKADDIIASMTKANVRAMPAFTWLDAEVGGCATRVARTGYTGERGYEIYVKPADAERFWNALMKAGEPHGLVPVGLGARDTLRLEMKYALYGNDIDLTHTPLEAGLGWVVKLEKGDFSGRAALVQQKEQGVAKKLVGFAMRERGIPRQGYAIRHNGQDVGVVTSGTHSPSLGEPIGVGYVPANLAAVGSTFDVVIRDKAVPAVVVKTPFLQRA